jgi:flagellar biosynthesis protein FliR
MISLLEETLPLFLLIVIRLITFFVVAPVFSMRGVPNQFKIGFGFFTAVVIYSSIEVNQSVSMTDSYLFLIIKETLIGLALGFVAALLLYTVQVAGAFIDFQMGFAIANVVDPQTGAQVPIIGNFKYMLALLFFVAVDGHHLLLDGIVKSYELLPLTELIAPIGSESIAKFMTTLFVQMFVMALQMALPIVGSLFLVDVALGILARTVPQVNVFVVGLPLKIFVGFIMLFLTMPVFFYLLQNLFRKIIDSMGQLIQLLGG